MLYLCTSYVAYMHKVSGTQEYGTSSNRDINIILNFGGIYMLGVCFPLPASTQCIHEAIAVDFRT